MLALLLRKNSTEIEIKNTMQTIMNPKSHRITLSKENSIQDLNSIKRKKGVSAKVVE